MPSSRAISPRTCPTCVFLLLLAAFCLFLLPVKGADVDKHGARPGIWTQDYTAAQALARERNLPIFLCFTGSDWCEGCILMDQKVFSTDEWNTYAPTLVLAFIDRPTKLKLPTKVLEQNAKLREKYNIQGYPTYVLVRPDGSELARLTATQNPDPELFIQKIRNAIPTDLVPKAVPASPGRPASFAATATPHTPTANPYAPRTWTSAAGTTITAAYVSYDGRAVTLRLPNGSLSRIAPANLSPADQEFLQPLIGHAYH